MAHTIPMPPADRQIAVNKVNGTGMDLLGPRTLRGICFHRALSNDQSLQVAADWLKNPVSRGLTDFFCDHRDGRMIRTNEITGTSRDMTGWAQGPYSAAGASTQGRAFRETFGSISGKGVHVVNSDLESCEVTGNYDTPISEECKQTLAQWTAARAQQLGCTAESFPISPITGLTVIYGHIEFCGKGHKICPGPVVWTFINDGELISRVRDLLEDAGAVGPGTPDELRQRLQERDERESAERALREDPGTRQGAASSPFQIPVMPAFWDDLQSGKPYVVHNGTIWYPDNLDYLVVRSTRRQQFAIEDDRIVGPDLQVGQVFRGAAKGQSHSDMNMYVITPMGTRVRMDALKVIEDASV